MRAVRAELRTPAAREQRVAAAERPREPFDAETSPPILGDQIPPGEGQRIEIIDLLENPQLASRDQILAIPTLIRNLPEPMRKIIGDLSNVERVLVGLDLSPRP